jgi:hypothetical protein
MSTFVATTVYTVVFYVNFGDTKQLLKIQVQVQKNFEPGISGKHAYCDTNKFHNNT